MSSFTDLAARIRADTGLRDLLGSVHHPLARDRKALVPDESGIRHLVDCFRWKVPAVDHRRSDRLSRKPVKTYTGQEVEEALAAFDPHPGNIRRLAGDMASIVSQLSRTTCRLTTKQVDELLLPLEK